MKWNSLNDRQKSLDRAIDQCGIKLDNSEYCLRQVMQYVNAMESEAGFIRERILLHLHTEELLQETDNFISNTETMLDEFEKDDEEWRRKGQCLGFKS